MQDRSVKIKDYLTLDKVEPTNDYHLISTFSDGIVKDFDCAYLLEMNYFKSLKNKGIFNKARANLGGVVWTDEIDLATKEVYEKGVTIESGK